MLRGIIEFFLFSCFFFLFHFTGRLFIILRHFYALYFTFHFQKAYCFISKKFKNNIKSVSKLFSFYFNLLKLYFLFLYINSHYFFTFPFQIAQCSTSKDERIFSFYFILVATFLNKLKFKWRIWGGLLCNTIRQQ